MGVQEDVNSASPVIIIDDHAHCSDLQSIRATDTAQMRATKETVTKLVRQWLGL